MPQLLNLWSTNIINVNTRKGERSRVRGKKYVLMLTLTLLLGALIASIPPVKASSTVKIYVKPEFPSYVPGTTGLFDIELWIESPPEWENTVNGIVGWSLYVDTNASVLFPAFVTAAQAGYFIYDFLVNNNHFGYLPPNLLVGDINTTTGTFEDVSCYIAGWETLGLGAGGSGKILDLKYNALSASDYDFIDLFEVYYYTTAGGPEGMVPADIVVDGHYAQEPPYSYLHSTSSLIDLSNPVGTSWHELYPTYSTSSDLNNWVDTNGDGLLTFCDFIELNDTWYHVEDVTVTIQTRHSTLTGIENSTYSASSLPAGVGAGWTNPAYAYSPNTTYASTATDDAMQQYGDYGINLPSSASITKVEVGMKAYNTDNEKFRFYVSWDNGTDWSGYEQSGNLPLVDPVTVTWFDFSGAIDWYPENLTDANFRTRAHACKAGGGAMGTVFLDWIPVRVTYEIGLPMYLDFAYGNATTAGFDIMGDAIASPVNTSWYVVYPEFGQKYEITAWTDSDTSYNISVSDYVTWNGTEYHVDDLDTDIIISGPVEITPEFPLGLALEIGLIVTIAYVWWRSRRKTKITKQTKLAN